MSDLIVAVGKVLFKVVEWLLDQLLGDTYTHFKTRISKWLQRKIKGKSKRYQTIQQDDGVLWIAGRKTNFVVSGGSGEFAYDRNYIQTRYDDEYFELPQELKELRDKIEAREQMKKEQGQKHMYNTYQVALTNAFQTNTDIIEKPYPVLHFKRSDYYNFQATVASLDNYQLSSGETIREKYIDQAIQDLHVPSDVLSQGIGIVLTVVTADEKIVLTRRRADTGIRPNELDVSVVEAIDPYQDAVENSNGEQNSRKTIDLYKVAIRGLKQELGIVASPDQIHLLGFGVDLEYYQWNIIGTVKTELTSSQIIELKSSGIHGINELSKIEFIHHDHIKVAEVLRDQPLWSTAQIALYWTMVYDMGNPNKVFADRTFKSVFGRT
ncbi:hypothetical protein ACTQ5K_09500 [Niallia sp. Sow4_A1]|uniref:hypothetical protein n=1 Tax=unclassified Niallia TaxID=2837522 RepID=UPI00203C7082|nr:hypothetical protein [Niallia sp. MER TA 168]MCM3363443.1 hypothetical protein [Niallia sp. MER TA 168]